MPKETGGIELRNERDAAGMELWDRVKRVRTGVKSVLGLRLDGNSSEVEVVGGVRMAGAGVLTLCFHS